MLPWCHCNVAIGIIFVIVVVNSIAIVVVIVILHCHCHGAIATTFAMVSWQWEPAKWQWQHGNGNILQRCHGHDANAMVPLLCCHCHIAMVMLTLPNCHCHVASSHYHDTIAMLMEIGNMAHGNMVMATWQCQWKLGNGAKAGNGNLLPWCHFNVAIDIAFVIVI